MQVTLIATLCQLAAAAPQSACVEVIITDQAEFAECVVTAQAGIAKWMSDHPFYRSGWRLAKWSCAIGGYQKPVHA